MESGSGNGSSINLSTNSSTNLSESEPFISEKKAEISQDHIHFIPNATTTNTTTTTPHSESSTFLPTNDQSNPSMMQKGDENSINSHLEANNANPFGDFHPSFPNNSETCSSSSSISQNPFLLLGDDTTTNITHVNTTQSENLHDQVPFEPSLHQPSTDESSLGNTFQVPTTSTITDSHKIVEHHDHGNEWHHQDHWSLPSHEETTHPLHASSSSQQLDPLFTLESTQKLEFDNAADKKHEAPSETTTQQHMQNSLNASSHTKEDTIVHPKSRTDIVLTSESSDDDIPISSMPKHEQQSSDVDVVPKTIQNPPIQMMERQEDPAATSSTDRIPLHVFDRTKSNNQWSTASNESLFSIHMGTMSFSNDIALLSKSGELDKPIDHNHLSKSGELDKPIDHNHSHNMSGGFQTNHHPLLPQPQGTKFNDISQNFGEQDGGLRVTEEKAAETMRQVIMESSVEQESKTKGDSTSATAAARSKLLSNSNNDHSHHSDGSTRSYAFKVMTDGDKTLSSKRSEDVRKQVKQPGQQNVKGTPAAPQNPKSTPNASQNKWLSCFTCCH